MHVIESTYRNRHPRHPVGLYATCNDACGVQFGFPHRNERGGHICRSWRFASQKPDAV